MKGLGRRQKVERCSVCTLPVRPGVATDDYPWRVTIMRKKYVVCNPRCAFELGTRHGALVGLEQAYKQATRGETVDGPTAFARARKKVQGRRAGRGRSR